MAQRLLFKSSGNLMEFLVKYSFKVPQEKNTNVLLFSKSIEL